MEVTPKNVRYIVQEIYIQRESRHPNVVEFKGCFLHAEELWVNLKVWEVLTI